MSEKPEIVFDFADAFRAYKQLPAGQRLMIYNAALKLSKKAHISLDMAIYELAVVGLRLATGEIDEQENS